METWGFPRKTEIISIEKRENKNYLDLKKIAKNQLSEAGILNKNIEIIQECTYSNKNRYFSYRRDKPQEIKAMLAVIGIKSSNLLWLDCILI